MLKGKIEKRVVLEKAKNIMNGIILITTLKFMIIEETI